MQQTYFTRFALYFSVLFFSIFAEVTGPRLYAQVTTGSVPVVVADQTGATIPNAEISIVDVDRNQTKMTKSSSTGTYRIDFLLAGTYKLSVSTAGFKTYVQTGIALEAGAPLPIDPRLNVGSVNETVEVTEGAPLVQTSNAELGTTVTQREVVKLPLVNRNAYTLLDLTPGVQSTTVTQSFGAPTQRAIINGGINNGSGSTNYFLAALLI